MSTYRVKRLELHIAEFEVEAASLGEAIALALEGEGECVSREFENVHVESDEIGCMSFDVNDDDYAGLIQELNSRRVFARLSGGRATIPGIFDFHEVIDVDESDVDCDARTDGGTDE